MLRFLHPMVLEQALEQRIEVAIVADRAEIVLLAHPLDHQDHETDRERVVAQDLGADRLGRTDHLALDRKAADERLVEPLEQLDVLGLLRGEIENRADAPVVAAEMRPRMVDHERQDELLDHAENAEILVRADVVEDALLVTD